MHSLGTWSSVHLSLFGRDMLLSRDDTAVICDNHKNIWMEIVQYSDRTTSLGQEKKIVNPGQWNNELGFLEFQRQQLRSSTTTFSLIELSQTNVNTLQVILSNEKNRNATDVNQNIHGDCTLKKKVTIHTEWTAKSNLSSPVLLNC